MIISLDSNTKNSDYHFPLSINEIDIEVIFDNARVEKQYNNLGIAWRHRLQPELLVINKRLAK